MTPRTGQSRAPLIRSAEVPPISTDIRIRMDWRRQWRRVIAVALIGVGLGARPAAAQTCVGDCKGEGHVDITDLIIGVNMALGVADVSTCEAFANSQGKVDITQLIQGVNNALNGCAGSTITLTGSCAAPGSGNICI